MQPTVDLSLACKEENENLDLPAIVENGSTSIMLRWAIAIGLIIGTSTSTTPMKSIFHNYDSTKRKTTENEG